MDCKIVHTGQHYDYAMSQTFFEDLDLPQPHFFLNAGSGSHAVQTAKIMMAFEDVCLSERPDMIVVVGDVNSTLACAIVGKKLNIKVAHVEAGLRSFDLTMPEEINRMVTDAISDHFFITEQSAMENLLREGKKKEQIFFVGNVMIDNLFQQVEKISEIDPDSFATNVFKKKERSYAFLTLHRPSNVDDCSSLKSIIDALNEISSEMPIFFPIHPRTKKQLETYNFELSDAIVLSPPLGFRESLFLWKDSAVVLTDSGGLQEETTALGIPCVTIRENTERPITLSMGSNILAGTRTDSILSAFRKARQMDRKDSMVPPHWDGKAAERITNIVSNLLKNDNS